MSRFGSALMLLGSTPVELMFAKDLKGVLLG
jgi:hypothetical protein